MPEGPGVRRDNHRVADDGPRETRAHGGVSTSPSGEPGSTGERKKRVHRKRRRRKPGEGGIHPAGQPEGIGHHQPTEAQSAV